MDETRINPTLGLVLAGAALVLLLAPALHADEKEYRGMLGPDSKKIKKEGDKVFIWAGRPSESEPSEWYDFTGSPIPPEQLQFGIGKYRIKAIDDPLFVAPDDPRLLKLPPSPYRTDEKIETNDDIPVIGYVIDGQARAYPTSLLDRHELVNDTLAGKPILVGW